MSDEMRPLIPRSVYITQTMLEQAQIDFNARYFAQQQPNFLNNIAVDWTQLYNYLTANAIGQQGITTDNLILRFIHRYADNAWYLTANCGIMSNPVKNDDGTTTYDVTDTNIFFALHNTKDIIPDSNPSYYASDYFNNFYFQPPTGPMVNLAADDPNHTKYVGNILYPWKMEIVKLCADNGFCDNNGAPIYTGSVSLKFISVSFSPDWPHGLMMLISANGLDKIKNELSDISFCDLAADYGGMCPPNCNKYTKPADL